MHLVQYCIAILNTKLELIIFLHKFQFLVRKT
jgi:hypothetical protein